MACHRPLPRAIRPIQTSRAKRTQQYPQPQGGPTVLQRVCEGVVAENCDSGLTDSCQGFCISSLRTRLLNLFGAWTVQ